MFCLTRQLPDADPIERLTAALRKFGILAKEGETPSDEQKTLQQHFNKRVAILKGSYLF